MLGIEGGGIVRDDLGYPCGSAGRGHAGLAFRKEESP